MTYSCSDFTADVASALGADDPENLSDQATVALDVIERLQGIEKAARPLLDWCREHTSPLDPDSPHQLLIALAAALDRQVVEIADEEEEDEDEDDTPPIGTRSVCTRCGQDVEWNGEEWTDRGGSASCGTAFQKPGPLASHTIAEEDEDDGCPKSDPECLGNAGDCHDDCVSPTEGEA
jgi:hypothetical protein